MNIVITGDFLLASRDEIEIVLVSLGHTCSSSVSKRTEIVLVGQKPGSKREKAIALGIPTSGDLLALVPDLLDRVVRLRMERLKANAQKQIEQAQAILNS